MVTQFCPNCGTAVFRSAAEQQQKMYCPRCDKDLVYEEVGGLIIPECTICGGIWLEIDVFQKICDGRDQ